VKSYKKHEKFIFIIALLVALIANQSFADTLSRAYQAYHEGDFSTAIRLLETAAEEGNSKAEYHLGRIYLAGEIAPKDIDKGVSYLNRAMSHGNGRAFVFLGTEYLRGRFIEKNVEKGIELLTSAYLEFGYASAAFNIAGYYGPHGWQNDEAPDEEKHVFWMERAAMAGDSQAQYQLAFFDIMGGAGIGKYRNMTLRQRVLEAYRWTSLSASLGNESGIGFLGIMEGSYELSVQEEKELQDWLVMWRAKCGKK